LIARRPWMKLQDIWSSSYWVHESLCPSRSIVGALFGRGVCPQCCKIVILRSGINFKKRLDAHTFSMDRYSSITGLCGTALNCVRDDVPGRSGKTNGIVIAAKCAPAEGENFPGKKQAGAKLNMPVWVSFPWRLHGHLLTKNKNLLIESADKKKICWQNLLTETKSTDRKLLHTQPA
jgi:hypothetical protein